MEWAQIRHSVPLVPTIRFQSLGCPLKAAIGIWHASHDFPNDTPEAPTVSPGAPVSEPRPLGPTGAQVADQLVRIVESLRVPVFPWPTARSAVEVVTKPDIDVAVLGLSLALLVRPAVIKELKQCPGVGRVGSTQSSDETIWERSELTPEDVAEIEKPPHLVIDMYRHAGEVIGAWITGGGHLAMIGPVSVEAALRLSLYLVGMSFDWSRLSPSDRLRLLLFDAECHALSLTR